MSELCMEAIEDTDVLEEPIRHECGLDEGHEDSHKCYCGEEF